jgi:two-component system, cell cycle response regulator DivK
MYIAISLFQAFIPSGIPFMSFKILIVEDNEDSRDLLHFLLTTKGYSTSTAVDGKEGVYMAKVEKPDLIITDLTMPNIDGIELTRMVRSEPEIANIPIIVYTSYGSDTANPAIEAGATQIFYKPIDFDKVLNYIDTLLESSKDI